MQAACVEERIIPQRSIKIPFIGNTWSLLSQRRFNISDSLVAEELFLSPVDQCLRDGIERIKPDTERGGFRSLDGHLMQ